jgi:hypothetical protein
MSGKQGRPLVLHVGHDELVVRRRYEAASIVIALWFIAGSVMFFSEAWTTAGTWCFLVGSVELLIRPVIRLGRQLHIRRVRSSSPGSTGEESSQDFRPEHGTAGPASAAGGPPRGLAKARTPSGRPRGTACRSRPPTPRPCPGRG